MKSLRLSFLLLITLLSGIAAVAQTPKQTPPAVRWEYKMVCGCCRNPEDIGALGDQGWELISVAWSGENSNCERFYLKRQKPKDAPAYVRPELRTTPPPRCQLTLEQAPAIRGFRLGMSVDEILALMPESAEKLKFKADLERASLPQNYGAADIYLVRNLMVLQTPANLERFAGIERINFLVLDNRIASIYVIYLRVNSPVQLFWIAESWAAKIAQAFSLPDLSFWDTKVNPSRLTCSGFSVSADSGNQSVEIRDNTFQKTIEQRRAAEQERLRREFKP